MPLEIRLIKDSEYEAVNDFFNSARSVDHRSQKTARKYNDFCWEFLNGPSGKAIYAVAVDKEDGMEPRIVGIQCAIPLQMISSDGKHILTSKSEDTLVDMKAQLKYRKTDILKQLYAVLFEECRKQGIEYMWGFTDATATFKRLDFEIPFKSSYGVLVLNPLQAYKHIVKLNVKNTLIDKCKIAALAAISFFLSLKRLLIFSSNKNDQINFDLSENVDLFERASSQAKPLFFLLQDKDYLQWRIAENPHPVKYKSFQIVNRESVLQAQVICSINKNVAFVEQVLFDKNLSKKTKRSLLKKIIKSLYKENICLVRCLGYNSNDLNKKEMRLLKKIGFVFTKKGEPFVFKNLASNQLSNQPTFSCPAFISKV